MFTLNMMQFTDVLAYFKGGEKILKCNKSRRFEMINIFHRQLRTFLCNPRSITCTTVCTDSYHVMASACITELYICCTYKIGFTDLC